MSKTGAQSLHFGLGPLRGGTGILLLSAVTLKKCLTGPRWGHHVTQTLTLTLTLGLMPSLLKSSRAKVFTQVNGVSTEAWLGEARSPGHKVTPY